MPPHPDRVRRNYHETDWICEHEWLKDKDEKPLYCIKCTLKYEAYIHTIDTLRNIIKYIDKNRSI